MGVTSCATLPFLPGTHVFSTVFKLLQANSTLFKHLWLVTILTGLGLGQLLHFGRELNSMEQVMGIMFVIILLGLLSDKLIFSPLEQSIYKRWGTNLA